MTMIAAGMTPAQFNTAMNDNQTSAGFIGKSVVFNTTMLGHEIKTGLALNSLGSLDYGASGQSFINLCNTTLSTSDKVISGAADVKTFGATGDGVTDDAADINTAVTAGNIIIQNGTFLIGASIKIPSNRTVYLFNCILKMADASYDNFFRNSDMAGGNSNIKIIGLGNVELNGNAANNSDNYATYGPKNTVAPYSGTIYRYNAIILCKVIGFEISGLYYYDIPHWGTYLQKSTNGSFHDIVHDKHTLVVNQDCVDVCHGCHDIDIYNISATVGDDFSAIAVANYSDMGFTEFTGWNVGDVYNISYHDITINDMIAGSGLTLLGGDGGKVYNIDVKDIRIKRGGSIYYNYYSFYCDVEPELGDIHDLTFERIQMDVMVTRTACFYFNQHTQDFTATNIINNTGEDMYILGMLEPNNVTINGVQVA